MPISINAAIQNCYGPKNTLFLRVKYNLLFFPSDFLGEKWTWSDYSTCS